MGYKYQQNDHFLCLSDVETIWIDSTDNLCYWRIINPRIIGELLQIVFCNDESEIMKDIYDNYGTDDINNNGSGVEIRIENRKCRLYNYGHIVQTPMY